MIRGERRAEEDRMAKIYTRGGDDGSTSLGDGARVSKDDPRVEAFGAIDEANCHIGLARAAVVESELDDVLAFVQQRLYNCTACLANPSGSTTLPVVSGEDVTALESAIDRLTEHIDPLSGFVLPGCDEAGARLHIARAVMRRAERVTVALSRVQPVDGTTLAFLNRASDLLFVAARYVGAGNECLWDPEAPRP
jgi:cob(I)alamin adenosyltransferase